MCVRTSVADPHHFDKDPDPSCHLDADPDPACYFDADPDPSVHVDPDPDPRFQIKAQNLEKVFIFHTFWLAISKLMRIQIRIQLITLTRGSGFYLSILCGTQIRIHNTGQDTACCFPFNIQKEKSTIFADRQIFQSYFCLSPYHKPRRNPDLNQ
jgi:hypothetical protein